MKKAIMSFVLSCSLMVGASAGVRFAPLAALTALAYFAPSVVSHFDVAEAQKKRNRRAKPKTKRSEVLGKSAYQRIEKAQTAMSEDDYQSAEGFLNEILDSERFKPYEKAVALQLIGQIFIARDDYSSAIATFNRALNLGALPARTVGDLTYSLAQLYFAQENTRRALEYLQNWFSTVEGEPNSGAYAFESRIYLVREDWAAAERSIRKAISASEALPKQGWIRILLAALFQQNKFDEARPVLEDAVSRWPGVKTFWEQLAAVYYEAEEEELAFVAKQALHVQGYLTSSVELSSMAQLYLYHGVPYKAAKILEDGMKAEKIEKTGKNYELLATSWQHASEWTKAIPPLIKAAEIAEKGTLFYQLGQTYLNDEKWDKAIEAFNKALKKGGINDDKKGSALLLLGIAHTNLEAWDAALVAFRKSGEYDDYTKDAYRWVRNIERRLDVERRRAKARDS